MQSTKSTETTELINPEIGEITSETNETVVVKRSRWNTNGDIVSKNNQNTVLMDRLFETALPDESADAPKHKIVALQAESRVFLFDCGTAAETSEQELDQKKEQCRDLLLKLYVAPLIRILKVGSTFFSVLDDATFACVVLLLFGSNLLSHVTKNKIDNILTGNNVHNAALIVTICSDILHNIMRASTKLWNLNRVDLPLVLVIYIAYFSILYFSKSSWLYWYVLAFRFFNFYLSECCHYWVDVLCLKILLKMAEKLSFNVPILTKLGFPYSRLNEDDREALTFYKGTYCSWNWHQSTVQILKMHDLESQRSPSKYNHACFYLGGCIAFVVIVFLCGVIICLVAAPYVIISSLCCCCKFFFMGIRDEIYMF